MADDPTTSQWGEADTDPVADVKAMVRMMTENCGYMPNRIVMPLRNWIRLMDRYHRRTLSRRAYRRWRGRARVIWAQMRKDAARHV